MTSHENEETRRCLHGNNISTVSCLQCHKELELHDERDLCVKCGQEFLSAVGGLATHPKKRLESK